MTAVLASAADARYGKWLLNLVGSVKRRSDIFDRIVVYDLGLTPFQRRLLEGTRGVQVREVPPFVPHWRQGRTWKTWIWRHLEGEAVVWLDAGITVLRPLTAFLDGVRERGYFVVSSGLPNRDGTPSDYYDLYGLSESFGDRLTVTAGILAFARSSRFFPDVIVPTYDDAVAGRSLGFSASEAPRLNWGMDRLDELVERDCNRFRHEQTLLSIHLYRAYEEPRIEDVYRFGGWLSDHDHPEQVIWNHRRRGDYRFLPRIPYRLPTAVIGLPWGTAVYLRHLFLSHRWLLRPSLYARHARRLLGRP